MASTNNNDFYKVSFITTKTATIPSMLSNTGGLIVMDDENKKDPKTGKDAMSLWLHGNCIASGFGFDYTSSLNDAQWWVNSYNKIFGGNSGLTANDFLENDPNIKDGPTYTQDGTTSTKPISIASRIEYATTKANIYTDKKFAEVNGKFQTLEGKISATDGAHNKKFNDLSNQIADVNSYAHTGVAYSVNYTDYWVNRILGGAPDFIDSLEEIKNYLDNDKENAMQTLGKLTELTNNTITHEQPVDRYVEHTENNEVIKDGKPQYTYMSEISYKEYIDESDESTKRTGTMTYWSYKDDNGVDRRDGPQKITYHYSYYVPKKEAVGMNAVTDKQVCCTDFNQHTLKQILKCIVNPYPYTIPTVTIDSIDDKPAKEWSETIIEYGTDLFTNSVNAFIDLKDASNVTSIKFDSDNDEKQLTGFTTSANVDYSDNIKNKKPYPVFNSKSSYTDFISNPYITLLTSYTINYGDAVNKIYPQLQSLNDNTLLDTEHAFKTGTVTNNLDVPLKKKIGIKTFYGTQTIPDNDVSLSAANYVWSENNGAFEMHISIDIENTNLIWFAVPDNLFDGTSSIILRSDDSNIITNFGSISSDILSKSDNVAQINHNGIVYNILTIENSEFPFADSSLTASIKW